MTDSSILIIVGNRPQYIKLGHFLKYKHKINKKISIVDSGQHYDDELSKNFFKEFKFKPNISLKVGSNDNSISIAKIITKFHKIIQKINPKLLIIFGDTNTTVAGAIAGKHLNVKILHIEAGERVFDQNNNPEETNRLLTDSISDYFITSSQKSKLNLIAEGKKKNKIFFTGDILYDLLRERVKKINFKNKKLLEDNDLNSNEYIFTTIHRKENTFDNKLISILKVLDGYDLKVILSAHPRTIKIINKLKWKPKKNLKIIPPLSYEKTLYFVKNSKFIVTDSGGLKREAFFLGKKSIYIKKGYPYWQEIDKQGMSITCDVKNLKKKIKGLFTKEIINLNKNIYGNGASVNKMISIINKISQ